MNFELWQLFGISVLYLGLLFVIATAAEKKWLPERLVSHPLVYTLSLGVYATTWSYYGSVGLADREGYTFLAVYLGVTLAFLASPILLRPILKLIKEYQLSSLADLLAFRYNSQFAGILVTLFMLTGTLPYTALQIQAVTDSLLILTGDADSGLVSLGFCLTISLFAILFGARHVTPREKHEGLVVAIAFESLVKLIALLVVGLYAVFGIFDGFNNLSLWLDQHPQAIEALMRPINEGPWAMMLLLSFSAAFLLPRQFHMLFVENIRSKNLCFASWAFPLFLLLLNISIPPILWAGTLMDLSYGADLYVLAVSLQSQSTALPVFIFIGGISAASAMIIVTTIALASMTLNHILLPLSFNKQVQKKVDLYQFLIWGKRALVLFIILLGYGFYLFLQTHQELTDLGLISFVAVAQFLPGIMGLLYWRRASRQGFIYGLLSGAVIWIVTLILPLAEKAGWLVDSSMQHLMLPMSSTDSAFWTLLANSVVFVAVSLLKPQDDEERRAADSCFQKGEMAAHAIPFAESVEQFTQRLAEITGPEMATKEIQLALADLDFDKIENLDRKQLAKLRMQIRHNLSGLVGPVLSDMVVNEQLQVDTTARVAIADTIQFVEKSLQDSRTEIKEMAGALDSLRRFHRQVLHDLPLAAVTISPDHQVISWNKAMEQLSGLSEEALIGDGLADIPEPWAILLTDFVEGEKLVNRATKVTIDDQNCTLNLFKSQLSRAKDEDQGFVVLIEDHSEIWQLESELAHSERLASIGRLATGVAHEIGNPVTGIACLAQDIKAMPEDTDLARNSIEDILTLTDRISSIVHSLVSYSHAGSEIEQATESVPLHSTVSEAVRLVSLSHKGKQINFINDCGDTLQISGNAQKLLQVIVILLSNACDASEEGSDIRIESEHSDSEVTISVIDSGHGIEERHLSRIFDPFFTTKEAGTGTGLGLSLAYNIVKEQGGHIDVSSQPDIGTQFTIRLVKSGLQHA